MSKIWSRPRFFLLKIIIFFERVAFVTLIFAFLTLYLWLQHPKLIHKLDSKFLSVYVNHHNTIFNEAVELSNDGQNFDALKWGERQGC